MTESSLLQCQHCGATLELAPNVRSASCAYCGSPNVVTRPADTSRPRPTFVVGFTFAPDLARAHVQKWISRSSLFTVGAFRRAKAAEAQPIYVPAYLYSAVARSAYAADIGEDYQETESYTEMEN